MNMSLVLCQWCCALPGQAHGKGIYVSKTPRLATGFARHNGTGQELLLCAVLDDASNLLTYRGIGQLAVTAESDAVRHVGEAIVVKREDHVLPLYKVRLGKETYHRATLHPHLEVVLVISGTSLLTFSTSS